MKEEEVINLSSKCNFNATKALPLKLEASGREYWRVLDNKDSLVLCYLNPSLGDHLDFLKISNLLNANNISTADVIYHNPDIGVTLQKDLGNDDLLTIFNDENKQDLLKRSLDLLAKIQELPQEEISKLTHDELVDQMHLFKDIFCINFLEVEPDNSIDDLMLLAIENIKQLKIDTKNQLAETVSEAAAINPEAMFSASTGLFAPPLDLGVSYTPPPIDSIDEMEKEIIGQTNVANPFDLDTSNVATGLRGFSAAGGGIAKLAGVDSGPPPASGPNSQGLQGLMKRVKRI